MADLQVGALPICDGSRLVGMLTDRDITIRSTASGQTPGSSRVGDGAILSRIPESFVRS